MAAVVLLASGTAAMAGGESTPVTVASYSHLRVLVTSSTPRLPIVEFFGRTVGDPIFRPLPTSPGIEIGKHYTFDVRDLTEIKVRWRAYHVTTGLITLAVTAEGYTSYPGVAA